MKINKSNCQELTGKKYETIVRLSGILGVNDFSDISDLSLFQKKDIFLLSEGVLYYKFKTNLIKNLELQVDFNELTIKNIGMKASKKGIGLSFRILRNQVSIARRLKFKYLKLIASRRDDIEDQLVGYNIWGKFGYIPTDSCLENVLKIVRNFNPSYSSLYELLQDESGAKYWRSFGRTWIGKFNLENDSESMNIFNNAKKLQKL